MPRRLTALVLCTAVCAALGTGCAPREQSGGSLASQETLTGSPREKPPETPDVTPGPDDPVATVNGRPITTAQLLRPMTEAYGLQFLLHLVQLELCQQKAAAAGIAITPEDVAAERRLTLEQMFKDAVPVDASQSEEEQQKRRQAEYERLLTQFLTSQRISLPEFDLAMRTGAYLRKLAEPGLKEQITEQHIQDGFGILFGEKVRVRHIQLANLREVAEAQRRLGEGLPFEQVATELSRDGRSRNNGGEIRAFSRAETSWPQAFKDAAFALKNPGDVSEPVHTGETYHLIKLIARIPPNSAVKYETHKDYVREELIKGLLAVRIRQLRESLAVEARSALRINDPVLRRQYLERLERAAGESGRDAEAIRREIQADHATTRPATRPAGVPEETRPPATMPGR